MFDNEFDESTQTTIDKESNKQQNRIEYLRNYSKEYYQKQKILNTH